MHRKTHGRTVRGATTITLWLAGAGLILSACRDDGVAGPSAPDGSMGSASLSSSAAALSFRQLDAGKGAHTCGVTTENRAYCWGLGIFGALGDGTFTQRLQPTAVVGGLAFRAVSGGNSHTCGVTTDNRAYCWGNNQTGRLGDGTVFSRESPIPVIGKLRFRQVSAGVFHTCGLTTTNLVYCWGSNSSGQLGDGTTITRTSPVAVSGGRTFRQLSTGGFHTCGVTTSYQVFCWGSNTYTQLGDGTTVARRVRPVAVAATLSFKQVSAGQDHNCAVTTGNRAYCWGYGTVGQMGDGVTLNRAKPRAVAGGLSFSRVTAGHFHTCGETTDNRGYCWGWREKGELGDGSTEGILATPTQIAGGLGFSQLTAGVFRTCGRTAAAVAYCWGDNTQGEIGDGTTVDRSTPVPVAGAM
jgi:alpha-tubulin suppressor-like RCC1 family protein